MCWYLTLIIPNELVGSVQNAVDARDTKPDAQTPYPQRLLLTEDHLPDGGKYIPTGYTLRNLTNGGMFCACDLYGDPLEDSPDPKSQAELIRARGKRKGWSPAKIERAVADSIAAAPPGDPWKGLRPDMRELIAECLPDRSSIGIFTHYYSGAETVHVNRSHHATIQQLLNHDQTLPPDTLVWVSRS